MWFQGAEPPPDRDLVPADNLVPTSTGAAKATTKALPAYQGKFDGVAVRMLSGSGTG